MLLCDILVKGQTAIAPVSSLISMRLQKLDATGVNKLEQGELEALFSAIPIEFELEQIFIEETLSDRLREQITAYINQRQGKIEVKPIKSVKEAPIYYNITDKSSSPNISESKMLPLQPSFDTSSTSNSQLSRE